MAFRAEHAASPKFIKARTSDSSVSHCTNPTGDFDWIWICTEECEFLDFADCRGVPLPVESVYAMSEIYDMNDTLSVWTLDDSLSWRTIIEIQGGEDA